MREEIKQVSMSIHLMPSLNKNLSLKLGQKELMDRDFLILSINTENSCGFSSKAYGIDNVSLVICILDLHLSSFNCLHMSHSLILLQSVPLEFLVIP